jgi:hypothetical protein
MASAGHESEQEKSPQSPSHQTFSAGKFQERDAARNTVASAATHLRDS